MRYGVIPWIFGAFLALGANPASAGNPSLDRILPQVREHHPGKFYDAEGPWRGPDGQYRYRLKWMTPGGRIVWFDADARTGRVLGPDFESRGDERERPRFRDDDRGFFPDNERHWNRGARWPRESGRPYMGHRR
jgi:hypothetical protein